MMHHVCNAIYTDHIYIYTDSIYIYLYLIYTPNIPWHHSVAQVNHGKYIGTTVHILWLLWWTRTVLTAIHHFQNGFRRFVAHTLACRLNIDIDLCWMELPLIILQNKCNQRSFECFQNHLECILGQISLDWRQSNTFNSPGRGANWRSIGSPLRCNMLVTWLIPLIIWNTRTNLGTPKSIDPILYIQ